MLLLVVSQNYEDIRRHFLDHFKLNLTSKSIAHLGWHWGDVSMDGMCSVFDDYKQQGNGLCFIRYFLCSVVFSVSLTKQLPRLFPCYFSLGQLLALIFTGGLSCTCPCFSVTVFFRFPSIPFV